MQYNKLVRDYIPDIIERDNSIPKTKILSPTEFKKELNRKLQEEVDEFLESGNVEELADIMEVIAALADLNKLSLDELEKIRIRKKQERGGFEKRIFLIEVEKK